MVSAMMATQAQMLKSAIEHPSLYPSSYITNGNSHERVYQLEEMLRNISEGKCGRASTHSLFILCSKYADLFDVMLLLASYRDNHSSEFHDKNIEHHALFLVRDTTGIWHAGSPANHRIGSSDSPLTKIISSRNLEEVISEISKSEGGLWPSADFINQAIGNGYKRPFITKEGGLLSLNIAYIRTRFGREEMYYDGFPVLNRFGIPLYYYH